MHKYLIGAAALAIFAAPAFAATGHVTHRFSFEIPNCGYVSFTGDTGPYYSMQSDKMYNSLGLAMVTGELVQYEAAPPIPVCGDTTNSLRWEKTPP